MAINIPPAKLVVCEVRWKKKPPLIFIYLTTTIGGGFFGSKLDR